MLAELGAEARVLAGGQSLVPMLNLRLARPSALVDVGRVAALSGISANGALRLGATTRQADALRSAAGGGARAAAERRAAPRRPPGDAQPRHPRRQHRPRRSRGGVAGRPARTRRRGDRRFRGGERVDRAASLFLGPFTTALDDGELLTELRLPDPPAGARHGFAEIARRRGDFALAGAAVVVAPGYARVALFGVAPAAFRADGGRARARAGRRRRGGGGARGRRGRAGRRSPRARRVPAEAARVAALRALLAAGVARG